MAQAKQKKKDHKQTILRGYKTELDLNAQQRQGDQNESYQVRFDIGERTVTYRTSTTQETGFLPALTFYR